MPRATIIAGNWKMHKTVSEGIQFLDALNLSQPVKKNPEILIFPPATSTFSLSRHRPDITFGIQNIHEEPQGAFTGEISAAMAAECATVALIGHSERRHVFMETDDRINRKIKAALQAGLRPMLCVGEKLVERRLEKTESVVLNQLTTGLDGVDLSDLKQLMVAYEPVWAIGTGLTATPEQAQTVHALIRQNLESMGLTDIPVLYGGSVKPENARELLTQPDIDGLLIGGASLQAENFSAIIALAYGLVG